MSGKLSATIVVNY
ncbi:hypothetical protein LINGRAHAP2_LOCUS27321 [Linum grandiflorum]